MYPIEKIGKLFTRLSILFQKWPTINPRQINKFDKSRKNKFPNSIEAN